MHRSSIALGVRFGVEQLTHAHRFSIGWLFAERIVRGSGVAVRRSLAGPARRGAVCLALALLPAWDAHAQPLSDDSTTENTVAPAPESPTRQSRRSKPRKKQRKKARPSARRKQARESEPQRTPTPVPSAAVSGPETAEQRARAQLLSDDDYKYEFEPAPALSTEPAASPVPAKPEEEGKQDSGDLVEKLDLGGNNDSGDLVEKLDLVEEIGGEPALGAQSPPAPDAGAEDERFVLTGWARQTAEVFPAAYGYSLGAEGRPVERAIARTQLLLSARYSRGRGFAAEVSGLTALNVRDRESPYAGRGFEGSFCRDAAVRACTRASDYETTLRELSVGFFSENLDLRVGQQRLAWGKADFRSPNDVLNAEDSRDPLIGERELRYQPTPLVRADAYLGSITVQLVYQPVFVPPRFDVSGSNWGIVQPAAPPPFPALYAVLEGGTDPTARGSVQTFLRGTRLPPSDLTAPGAGARLSWSAGSLEVSHYYHYGFTGPVVSIAPGLLASLATLPAGASAQDLYAAYAAADPATEPYRARYQRRHHVGLDAAIATGNIVWRVDAAYEDKRALVARDFTGVVAPIADAVVALDYQTGDPEKIIIVEGLYSRLIKRVDQPLLFMRNENIGSAAQVQWPLGCGFGVLLRGVVGFAPRSQVVQPQINFGWSNWTVSLGAAVLRGEPFTQGGYWRASTSAYAKAKYLF
jgi:hypothetical protein